jgi:Flp pilus assembly protein TadB
VITTLIAAALAAGAVALALIALRPGARDVAAPSAAAVTRRAVAPDLVDLAERIARDTRSGLALGVALEDALTQTPSVFPEVLEALRRHATLSDALARARPNHDERDVLVHALQLGAQHPHVAARVLDRAVVVIRERRAWRQERHVHAAQARTSARVLTLLPIGFALWGLLTSPSVRHAYATSTVVSVVAALGISMNVAGWWWMRRIVGGGP